MERVSSVLCDSAFRKAGFVKKRPEARSTTEQTETGHTHLFVYGSLMRGMGANHFLAHADFKGATTTASVYTLVMYGAFPGLTQGIRSIEGEVYAVSEQGLAMLDKYEGVPHLYIRKRVLLNARPAMGAVQAYFLNDHLLSDSTPYPFNRWSK